jgi:Zn-dependent protease
VKGSYRIARVAGIDVRVHVTFFLLLAFYAWSFYETGGFAGAVAGVTLMLLLFLCVLLHEFGHAFAARRYGIRTPDITLLPIGGLARLERMPTSPWQELMIAVAGPAVNVGIAAGIALAIWHVPDPRTLWQGGGGEGLLEILFSLNVMLIVFNMIPAFPMDGGRVLRSLLAMRLTHVRATTIAARTGQVIAVIFVGLALFTGNFILGFIALFVFMGAKQELAHAQMRDSVQLLRVGDLMNTEFRALPFDLTIGDLSARLSGNAQDVFPLVDGALHLHGMASREELLQAARELPPQSQARSVGRKIPTLRPETPLGEALETLHRLAEPVLPVVNLSSQIVGLFSLAHLQKFSAQQPSS